MYKDENIIKKLIEIGTEDALDSAMYYIHEMIEYNDQEVLGIDGSVKSIIKCDDDVKGAVEYAKQVHEICFRVLGSTYSQQIEDLMWEALRLAAPYDFDSFCLYIEKEREFSKRFYQPRRKQLLSIAKELQRLEDGEIDLLAISLPPGVGKTTLAIFFICWTSLRHPELQSLIGSHNNEFLRGVYDECLRVLDPVGEYKCADIFPDVGVADTNAKDLRIDLGKEKRFQTIEMTSLGSGNAGKVRSTNLLYCDDLCQGIEQAMSREQMDKLWQKYTVDLRQRKQGSRCKELHIQTRWSVNDVVGRLTGIYSGNEKAVFINIPAMDENGVSNFNYPYGIGFSTEMYEDIRNGMDDASWKALYMGEPIEREGQLYAPTELRRYFELPDREPDAIIGVCDTKEQGDDYCVLPVCYQYGNDYYIDDFICDNGKPEAIREKIVNKIKERHIQMIRFESNRGGSIFAQTIQDMVKGEHCKITTKWNQANKETRIYVASAWIKEHCLFLDETMYAKERKEYRTAMNFLSSYTMMGKNKHDDVPDAMADLENFVRSFVSCRIDVKSRSIL